MDVLSPNISSLLQALGFPAWALVVWALGNKAVDMLKNLLEVITKSEAEREKRIALLEATVERLDRIVERHDEELRK